MNRPLYASRRPHISTRTSHTAQLLLSGDPGSTICSAPPPDNPEASRPGLSALTEVAMAVTEAASAAQLVLLRKLTAQPSQRPVSPAGTRGTAQNTMGYSRVRAGQIRVQGRALGAAARALCRTGGAQQGGAGQRWSAGQGVGCSSSRVTAQGSAQRGGHVSRVRFKPVESTAGRGQVRDWVQGGAASMSC